MPPKILDVFKKKTKVEEPKKKVTKDKQRSMRSKRVKKKPAAGSGKPSQEQPTQANKPDAGQADIPPSTLTDQKVPDQKSGATKEVVKWVHRALDMGVVALQEEYRSLAKYTLPEMTMDAFRTNHEAGKNRYQDVPCQDQNRVVLKWSGCPIDYVHANYVATPHAPKRFICTQGPLDCTIMEFWTMVVQEDSNIIVMLCNVIECGKLKCAQYWPENEGDTQKVEGPNFEIINKGTTLHPVEPTVRKTMLLVKYKDAKGASQERTITHYQWLDWPDRGVPPCRLTAMELLSCVRGSKNPIVVHCSAGIGRTGTIVAIEYIMERLAAGQECAAMNELLKMLRDQRAYSIQNDLQYLYIHRVMLCYFLEKHKARYTTILEDGYTEKYAQFIVDYDQATGGSKPQ